MLSAGAAPSVRVKARQGNEGKDARENGQDKRDGASVPKTQASISRAVQFPAALAWMPIHRASRRDHAPSSQRRLRLLLTTSGVRSRARERGRARARALGAGRSALRHPPGHRRATKPLTEFTGDAAPSGEARSCSVLDLAPGDSDAPGALYTNPRVSTFAMTT